VQVNTTLVGGLDDRAAVKLRRMAGKKMIMLTLRLPYGRTPQRSFRD
jgi:hypothetical protein